MEISKIFVKSMNNMKVEVTDVKEVLSELSNFRKLLLLIEDKPWPTEREELFSSIRSYIQGYFSANDLIDYDVLGGENIELIKLLMLLIYIGIFNNKDFREKFLSNANKLSIAEELRLKYIIQNILKMEKNFTKTYFEILIKEENTCDDTVNHQTPIRGRFSSTVYSSSPRTTQQSSPLRSFLLSPQLRLQSLLNKKKDEIKLLQSQNYSLDNENSNLQENIKTFEKNIGKKDAEIKKLKEQLINLREDYDTMESRLDNEVTLDNRQVARLERDLRTMTNEKLSVESQLNESNLEVDEQKEKIVNLHNELALTRGELDRAIEELTEKRLQEKEYADTIQSQKETYLEMERNLKDLQLYLMEKSPHSSAPPKDYSFDEDSSFSMDFQNASASTQGENMADAVVDVLYRETLSELHHLKSNYSKLEENLSLKTNEIHEQHKRMDELKRLSNMYKEKSETLELNVKQKVNEISNSKNEIEKLEQELQLERQSLVLTKEQISGQTMELNMEKEKIHCLEQSLHKKMEEIVSQKKENESLQQQIQIEVQQSTSTRKELHEKMTDLEKHLQRSSDEKIALEASLKKSEEEIKETNGKILVIQEESTLKMEEVDSLQCTVNQKMGEITSLKSEIDYLGQELKQRRHHLVSAEEEFDLKLKKCEAELTTEKDSVNSLQLLLKEKESSISALKEKTDEEMADLKSEFLKQTQTAQLNYKNLEKETEDLKTQLEVKKETVNTLECFIKEKDNKIEIIEKEAFENVNKLKLELEKQKIEARSSYNIVEGQNEDMKTELQIQQEKFQTSELNLQLKIEELLAKKNEMEKLQKEMETEKLISISYKMDLDKMAEDLKTQLEVKRETVNTLECLIKEKDNKIEIIEKEAFEDVNKLKLEMEKRIIDAQSNYNIVEGQNEDMKAELKIQKENFQSLELNLQHKMEEFLAKENKMEKLQKELESEKQISVSYTMELEKTSQDLKTQLDAQKESVNTLECLIKEKDNKIEIIEKEAFEDINKLKLEMEKRIIEARSNYNIVEGQIEKLKEELKNANEKCQTLQINLQQKIEEILSSKNEIANLQQDLQTERVARVSMEKLESELKDCESRLKSQQETAVSLERLLKEKEITMGKLVIESTEKIEKLKADIEVQNAQSTSHYKCLEKKFKLCENELKTQKDVASSLEHIVQEKEKINKTLEDQLRKLEHESQMTILEMRKELQINKEAAFADREASIRHTNEDYEKRIKVQRESISSLESVIEIKEKIIAGFKEDLSEAIQKSSVLEMQLRNELKDQQSEKEMSNSELLSCKNELKKEREKISTIEECLKTKEILLSSVNEKLMKLETESAHLKDELVAQKISAYEQHEQDLANLRAQHKNELNSVEEKVTSLEATLIDRDQEISSAKEDQMRIERESGKTITSLKEELQSQKEKSIAEKEQAIKSIKKSYTSEVQNIMESVKKQEDLEQEVERFQHKYGKAKEKIVELMQNMKATEYENNKFKTENHDLKTSIQELETQKVDYEMKIKDLQTNRQPLNEKLKELEMLNKRLDQKNRSLEVQLNMADSSLRKLKKEMETQSISRGSIVNLHSGNEESNISDDLNDSQTLLIPKDKRYNLRNPVSKSEMFPKPNMRSTLSLQQSKSSKNLPSVPKPERSLSSVSSKRKSPSTFLANKKHKSAASVLPSGNLDRSVPREMAPLFACEDEEDGGFSNNQYLSDLKSGTCSIDSSMDWRRISEIQRRNSLLLPHMRSAYHPELQMFANSVSEDSLRAGSSIGAEKLLELSEATGMLEINSPSGYNLRSRKSLESIVSEGSITSSGSRKSRRLSQTSYSRPGPPTPAKRNSKDKENSADLNASATSYASTSSKVSNSAFFTPVGKNETKSNSHASPTVSALRSGNGFSPADRKKRTPASLLQAMKKGRSPWRKLKNEGSTSGIGDHLGSSGSSKLRIFRNPFGFKNYNVKSASERAKEERSRPSSLNSGRVLKTSNRK